MTAVQPNEAINGNGFTAEITRSNRCKTASIKVIEGKVTIAVPKTLSTEKIASILNKKNRWIKAKLALHQQTPPQPPKQYISGESFSYLGRNYRLKVIEADKQSIKLQHGRFVVSVTDKDLNKQQQIQCMLESWYKQHAEIKLIEKTQRYAMKISVEPNSIGIKDYQARWGSCTAHNDIYFNWKIIMAPNSIVDYVVVHELCHILHHNHSPAFWLAVNRYYSDYQECRDWLKMNGRGLEI